MKIWTKIKKWFADHKPSKRRIIQLYAALLFNANIKGFVKGTIYTGPTKNICTPGLNCYSCPGASGACPLGALQNSLASSNKRLPYYMFGIILLYGIIAGRWICSFLCPFGLIQELLHKIKTPKIKKSRVTRILSYFKYVILVVFVFIFPLMYMFRRVPLPAFCKYICPAGTLEGAMGLLSNKVNASWFSMLGPLFTWKFILLVSFVVGAIFMFRFFCRFFCPLGALYGLFNKISFFGIQLDKSNCTNCNLCVKKCQMDIAHVGDQECISCGECIDVCPTGAISWKGSKIILHANEINIDENVTPIGTPEHDKLVEEKKKKIKTRNTIIKVSIIASMAALLIGALLYYNVFYGRNDDKKSSENQTEVQTERPTEPPIVIPDTHGMEFELNADGESYTVTGLGDVTDSEIAIPATYENLPVTAIGESAFANTDITLLSIPSSITSIGAKAFENCAELTRTIIPESVTVIGENAFAGCSKATISCSILKADKPAGWAKNWCSDDVAIKWLLPATGYKVGMLCPEMSLDTYKGSSFNISQTKGKVTVINFWGTWCTPCVQELPHFNDIANEYSDSVAVIAIHSALDSDTGGDYISENFPGTKMIIPRDTQNDDYFKSLGGTVAYPMTLVLDADGIVVFRTEGSLTHAQLKNAVELALSK
ncbi:MAG: 4Fe-4S binding protein [Ruminococcaceae bacterium]|nr:4Fe-4S binding protein [Oscillospiraceae bacterium]